MSHPRITDICLITSDLEAGVEFYTEKLGFRLASRMPGFADFHGPGIILALWDRIKLRETTGIHSENHAASDHQVMLAAELDSPDAIDQMYESLIARDVTCYGPPRDYPWNARCFYFAGPTGEFWEFFAWLEGGKPGQVAS